jgi:predicted aldo/keto reductase-like oxidoreductase
MSHRGMNRREFLKTSALLLGTAAAGPLSKTFGADKPTAIDLVPLGKKGLQICRLGFGTGSIGGEIQRKLGQAEFTRLIRYAYEQGITYIDTADNYHTHGMVREAIKGLPRERLWIQSKMWWTPENIRKPLAALQRYRQELGTDYIDSLLIHCTMKKTWPEDVKPMMDAFNEAEVKKWIRMKGMSCHGLPALQQATRVDWAEVQLARVNPQGRHVDGPVPDTETGLVDEAMKEIRAMHGKGRGIIGMKLIGNGDFVNRADRERAIRYALTCGCVDAIVIGFKSTAEIDEVLENMNRALAVAA